MRCGRQLNAGSQTAFNKEAKCFFARCGVIVHDIAVIVRPCQDCRMLACLTTDWVSWATLSRNGKAATPSPLRSTTSATDEAASEGLEATAIPTSAAAKAGASFIPSPTCKASKNKGNYTSTHISYGTCTFNKISWKPFSQRYIPSALW